MKRPNWYGAHPEACTCVSCQRESVDTAKVRDAGKIGRNASCPCGSGKKFKKCHGGIDT